MIYLVESLCLRLGWGLGAGGLNIGRGGKSVESDGRVGCVRLIGWGALMSWRARRRRFRWSPEVGGLCFSFLARPLSLCSLDSVPGFAGLLLDSWRILVVPVDVTCFRQSSLQVLVLSGPNMEKSSWLMI